MEQTKLHMRIDYRTTDSIGFFYNRQSTYGIYSQGCSSLAKIGHDDEVNVGHILDGVLMDGVHGHTVFCRKPADSPNDADLVPAEKETQHSTLSNV